MWLTNCYNVKPFIESETAVKFVQYSELNGTQLPPPKKNLFHHYHHLLIYSPFFPISVGLGIFFPLCWEIPSASLLLEV